VSVGARRSGLKIASTTSPLFADLESTTMASESNIRLLEYSEGIQSQDGDIICCDKLEPAQVVDAVLLSGANHFIQKNKDFFAADIETTAGIISQPESYFKNNVTAILPQIKESKKIVVSNVNEKESVRAQIYKFIEPVKNNCLEESLFAIFEELFMNAMIDAPVEFLKLNRSTEMNVQTNFHLAYSDNRLVISCEDRYGSLNVQKFILRMNEVYQNGAGRVINMTRPGGAGLGCVVMFEHCISLYLGVQKSNVTLVSCSLPMGVSFRQKSTFKKSLHLIQL
jgi:hypothetical protein